MVSERRINVFVSRLNRIYTETANEHDLLVIPVGLAFAEAYKEKNDIELHKSLHT